MDTTLEFSYKPRSGPSIALLSLFLAGIVLMASLAMSNDAGLAIDGIITLDTASATAFYWFVVAACLWPLFLGVHALRLSQQKSRCIVLSKKDVTVPGLLPGAPTVVVPLDDIAGLAMHKGRYTRTLIVRHGTNQTRIVQGHFADNASFERFLSQLQTAIHAVHRPADAAELSSAHESEPHLHDLQTTSDETAEEPEDEERTEYIREIRAAGLLDAVFLLFLYNSWVRYYGPKRPPALDVSEVLPELSQSDYERALALVDKMWSAAGEVGLAYYGYPEARHSFEEAVVILETENPGFSDKSYGRAVNAAYVNLR